MRRIKIGDVFYVKLKHGLKLFQWAYDIPRYGTYIRVFSGLYQEIPNDIRKMVEGEHSYIIFARIRRLYRLGLAQFVENYTVPGKYTFPRYKLDFAIDGHDKVFSIKFLSTGVDATISKEASIIYFDASRMSDLPLEFQGIKLLNPYLSPDLLFYLFDYDFTLDNLERFYPHVVLGTNWRQTMEEYWGMIEKAEEEAEERRRKKRSTDGSVC